MARETDRQLITGFWLAIGCLFASTSLPMPAAAAPPTRVVSTNLCTDQLAIILAAPGQLHSVSYISQDPETSVLANKARKLVPNHGLAEEIFLMKPDLVLAGAFTRRATTAMLRRLGFRVETFYPAQSFQAVRKNIKRVGELLGRTSKTQRLLANFDAKLREATVDHPPGQQSNRAALYYANNYTSGSGTLSADIVGRAGLTNIADAYGLAGLVKLPLELLITAKPDVIITERHQGGPAALAYQAFTHPALRAVGQKTGAIIATDKNWSCGAPFTIDAIRRLHRISKNLATSAKANQ